MGGVWGTRPDVTPPPAFLPHPWGIPDPCIGSLPSSGSIEVDQKEFTDCFVSRRPASRPPLAIRRMFVGEIGRRRVTRCQRRRRTQNDDTWESAMRYVKRGGACAPDSTTPGKRLTRSAYDAF